MTSSEKATIRRMFSDVLTEHGRVKGILTKESVNPRRSFSKETDGLDQVQKMTEVMRKKIEEVLKHDLTDFQEIFLIAKIACDELHSGLSKIEIDLNKT